MSNYSVQKFKKGTVTKTEIDYFSKRDKELLISPEFFINLKTRNELISHIEVMPKIGIANHEMNNYRYDVILHIKNKKDVNNFIINESDFIEVNNIEKYIEENIKNDYLCIKYRNKRIEKEYLEFNKVINNDLSIKNDNANNTLSMESIVDSVRTKKYKVKFLVNMDSPLYFNIILYDDNITQDKKFYIDYISSNKISKTEFSNNPLYSSKIIENQLTKKIKVYLASKLPNYMIPEYYIQLENLPLTINGKLDRKALPNPEFINIDNYVSPQNELEAKVCNIWADVLGLDEEKVGIKDDFFSLGGNSILAIKLISKLNSYYKSHLKVSDIFIYKNISLLLPRIIQTKHNYQTIVKLNNIYDKPNIFMIHPGAGGCESYISLSKKLAANFSCYGVDSYNLYNYNKIDNLHELAKYYLSHIEEVMQKVNQEEYHLLGWSLGGQISLEIASILEKKGVNNIKVYLLDTIIHDNYLNTLMKKMDMAEFTNKFREYAIIEGYEKNYIEKSISNLEVENKLACEKISSTLINSKIILFKAILEDTRFKTIDTEIIYSHIKLLNFNNIDLFVEKKSRIKVVEMHCSHHGNILEKESFIVSEIISFLKN